jgi:carbonic anhydrase
MRRASRTAHCGLMRAFLPISAALVMATTHAPADVAHHWSYGGPEGPSHWAKLDAKYRLCGSGQAQSPVDIRLKAVYKGALPELDFEYRPAPFHITDNGHSVQVDVEPGSSLHVGTDRYELVQFHFHHPSEEEVDGKRFDMVAHLVHKDSKGALAVVAIPLKVGHENPLLATLWNKLPKHSDHHTVASKQPINAADLVPSDHGYFSYTGSLTTPPCSEGLRWMVLKTPEEISKSQLDAFASRYPNDARPIQKLNGRHVIASK